MTIRKIISEKYTHELFGVKFYDIVFANLPDLDIEIAATLNEADLKEIKFRAKLYEAGVSESLIQEFSSICELKWSTGYNEGLAACDEF